MIKGGHTDMNSSLRCVECREVLPENLRQLMDMKGNVFYSEKYYNAQLANGFKPVYLYDEEYFLLAVICKEWFVFKAVALPVECLLIQNQHEESEKEFLNKVVSYLKTNKKVHWIGPTSTSAFFMAYPDDSEWIPFGSHVVDLTQPEDILWNHIHSKHRNVIRKAEKAELNIVSGNSEKLIRDFAYLDKVTWERSGQKGHGIRCFESLIETYGEQIIIFCIYKEDEIQGGIILQYNKCMAYYLYGGSVNNVQLGAMNYLHWYAMLYLKKKQVRKYSFLGCRINEDENSKYHTLQRFKSRFGGELVSGYMFKVPCNSFMYRLERRLRYIKRNHGRQCPLDIIDEERYKWV